MFVTPILFKLSYVVDDVDKSALKALFNEYDVSNTGSLNIDELEQILIKFGVAPSTNLDKETTLAKSQKEEVATKEETVKDEVAK